MTNKIQRANIYLSCFLHLVVDGLSFEEAAPKVWQGCTHSSINGFCFGCRRKTRWRRPAITNSVHSSPGAHDPMTSSVESPDLIGFATIIVSVSSSFPQMNK